MPKVYLVNNGESYSDYGIDGIFSTRELAEAAINNDGSTDLDRIEEFELDAGADLIRTGQSFWWVNMDRNGNSWSGHRMPTGDLPADQFFHHSGRHLYYMVASDVHEATKIANERRTRQIAEGTF